MSDQGSLASEVRSEAEPSEVTEPASEARSEPKASEVNY